MKQIEEILLKYNWPKRTDKSNTSFEEIEKLIKFKLPSDYKVFLKTFSAYDDFIGEQYVSLWDMDEIIEANTGSGLLEFLPNTIGIGGDGASELIAIESITQGNHRIVLTPLLFEKECHIDIGSSFTDFLIRLDNGANGLTNIKPFNLRKSAKSAASFFPEIS